MNEEQNLQPPMMEPQQVGGPMPAPTPQNADPAVQPVGVVNQAPAVEPVMQQPAAPMQPETALAGSVPPSVPKKMPKGLIIGVLAAVVVAVAAFCAFKFLAPTPYKIYKGMIKETFAQGREILGFNNDDVNSATISGNLLVDTNIDGMDGLGDYSYDFLYGYDIKNNKMELMLGLKEKDKTILDAFAYILNDQLYVKSDKLLDYPISFGEVDINLEELMEEIPMDDIEYLYDKLEEALINSLSEDDFETTTKKVKVDGKEVEVKDNYVVISGKNINKILKGFLNTFKNDSKTLDILANMTGEDSSTIKEMIDMILEQDLSMFDVKIRLSIYTKSLLNKSAGYAIKIEDEEILNVVMDGDKGVVEMNLGDIKYTADINGKVADIKLEMYGEELVTGKITSVSDEETKVELNADGVLMNFSIVYKQESKKVETLVLDVELKPEDEDIGEYIKVKLSLRSELDAKVADVNVNDAQDFEDLDTEDLTSALENLLEIIEDTPIYSIVEMVMEEYEDSYYEDDYYDDYYDDDDYYFDEDDYYYDEDDFDLDFDEDNFYYDDTY